MLNEYCIGVVGARNERNPQLGSTITHERIKYELLMNVNVARLISGTIDRCLSKQKHSNRSFLLVDVRCSPEFCFKQFTFHYDTDNVYLGLFFQPWLSKKHAKNIRSKYRIIQSFFDINASNEMIIDDPQELEEEEEKEENTDEPSTNVNSVSELYSMLSDAHANDNEQLTEQVTMPEYFVPELRSYQTKALQWMLRREKNTKYSLPEFMPVTCHSIPNMTFYFNYRTVELMDCDPGGLKIPTGGILADEMGLGKTVEMLALILTNPNRNRTRSDFNHHEAGKFNIVNDICKILRQISLAELHQKLKKNQILKCVCTNGNTRKTVQCPRCLYFQHEVCVAKYSVKPIVNYICPECWKLEPLTHSPSTFIVSPPSIKMQWQDEIQKHIADTKFRVLIYNGIKQSGWISPADLKTYDVVLTDYNIMKSEIYYSESNKRETVMRTERKYIIPTSPLTMIHWWRVVLDEAQMVETPKNNCSRMVKSLPAVHRWSVTGTPIEKSIDNLYGLLYFLDYEPFTDFNVWKTLSLSFSQGDIEPLINKCLKNVMWRTCKINVWEEIGLPPQTEIVHSVTMCDTQAFFYADQHNQCANAFFEKAQKLGKSLSMFKMNPKTLKLIMTPLLKLRQDCTVPTVFQRKSRNEAGVKKVLTPDELLKHMTNNNEINCKERLRMITSCLNGLAALHIIKDEFESARKMYESVLRWAKDYTGTICVDSLLQVHALYNLLEINEVENVSPEKVDEYTKELERLEWKYLENSINLVQTERDNQQKVENEIIARTNEAWDSKFNWWTEFLETFNVKFEQQLMDRIFNDLRNYQNACIESVSSTHGIMYVVGTWLDKIEKERKEVQKWFKKLQFFSANLKPRSVLDADNLRQVDFLVKSAFECHLNKEKEGETKSPKPKKSSPCLLCQVKQVLLKYECLIFSKTFVDDAKENVGNWNPSYQETMLRVIYSFAKRDSNETIVNDGELHLQVIELIKDEYKKYSQYWVEINHSAAAYDELKMCKSRMQIYDPDLEDESTKSKLKVSKYEIHDTFIELRQDKEIAELDFVRIQGVLKYLKHLQNKEEPDACPICKEIPTTKYCVLQCGHHICDDCFLRNNQINRNVSYKCCICRHQQKVSEIHFVTCKRKDQTTDESIVIAGHYSQKIQEIVRTTLKLRNEDSNVKIIIFSHWETILNVVASALTENSIEFRSKSYEFPQKCK
ncbi:hypothetical protein HA402_007726 [Bradysia odoriphaga]|nr:hypothetical protein HA402_007726 [Bradysia odoriphaga]